MHRWAEIEGAPSPLGLTWIAEQQAYNFALYSRYATAVALLLYAPDDPLLPIVQVPLNYLINKSGRVWHCRLPAATVNQAAFYAYRVDGPHDPAAGYRFDAEKILLDPYARSVYFPPQFSRAAARRAGSNDGKAPLGLLHPLRDTFDWRGEKRVRHGHDTVIYEMHVKGFTKRSNSGVSRKARHLRRRCGEDSLSQGSRSHGSRALARPSAGSAGRQLLGLYDAQFLLPGTDLRSRCQSPNG
jgi:glycogen operon protein